MTNHIDVIANQLRSLLNGHPSPALMSDEMASVMVALASIKDDDFHLIGSQAATALLNRLQAGITSERALKIMRGGDNPMRPN